MNPRAFACRLVPWVGMGALTAAACGDAPCEDTLTCDLGPTGGSSPSSSSGGGSGGGGAAGTRMLGESCTDGGECQSGFCADDVCCDTACDGACVSCRAVTGSCEPHDEGTDPDGDCAGSVCDGGGMCGPPPLSWARQFGDVGLDDVYDMAATNDGGVVVVGSFRGSVNFGGGVITSYAGADAFVVKLDEDGNHVWSRRFGDQSPPASTNEDERALSVSIGADGTAWIGIELKGDSYNFGGGLVSATFGDAALVALDSASGGFVSAAVYSGALQPLGLESRQIGSVAATSTGGLVIAGRVEGGMTVDGVSVGADNSLSGYVYYLDANLSHQWHEDYAAPGAQSEVRSIALAPNGDVVVCGAFLGTVMVGGSPLSAPSGGGVANLDGFVARLTSAGERLWAHAFGDVGPDSCESVAVGPDGRVVAVGSFVSNANFGGEVALIGSNAPDGFIVSFSPNGVAAWAKHLSGPGSHSVRDVVVDGAGFATVFAGFEGSASLDGLPLESAGQLNVLFARLGPSGDVAFSATFGDGTPIPVALDTTSDGKVVLAGHFSNTLPLGPETLIPAGSRDVFVLAF